MIPKNWKYENKWQTRNAHYSAIDVIQIRPARESITTRKQFLASSPTNHIASTNTLKSAARIMHSFLSRTYSTAVFSKHTHHVHKHRESHVIVTIHDQISSQSSWSWLRRSSMFVPIHGYRSDEGWCEKVSGQPFLIILPMPRSMRYQFWKHLVLNEERKTIFIVAVVSCWCALWKWRRERPLFKAPCFNYEGIWCYVH